MTSEQELGRVTVSGQRWRPPAVLAKSAAAALGRRQHLQVSRRRAQLTATDVRALTASITSLALCSAAAVSCEGVEGACVTSAERVRVEGTV
jgi:hypothetical protein